MELRRSMRSKGSGRPTRPGLRVDNLTQALDDLCIIVRDSLECLVMRFDALVVSVSISSRVAVRPTGRLLATEVEQLQRDRSRDPLAEEYRARQKRLKDPRAPGLGVV